MTKQQIRVIVNDEPRDATVEARKSLVDFLREDLELTGTHVGCEHGVCGACTVLLDGASVRSCLVLAVQADGSDVRTIEGLERDGVLHPIQRALHAHHAFQCGFCTPGFVMTAVELYESGTTLDEAELRAALSGNLCRCTGYQTIVEGIAAALTSAAAPAAAGDRGAA